MITESERPPSKINGKVNPAYRKWYRTIKNPRQYCLTPHMQEASRRYYLSHKKKSSKPCDCGCGGTVDREGARFIRGHCMRLESIRAKHHDKVFKNSQDPRYQKKMSESLLKLREKHPNALVWRLKSPDNKTYTFKNLRLFVRENSHLFHPDDIVIKPGQKYGRAVFGLHSISPRAKKPNGSWKGWRIDSQQERLFHEGKTLLEDITPPRASSSTTRETPPH